MSQTVPDSRFRRFWLARPITLLVVGVVVVLHAGVRLTVTAEHDREAAFRSWGLLEIQKSTEHSELTGPFDLWAGEWWRVPLGGLHHAGWWHLAFVSSAFFYLGRLLEPKLPPVVYALFLLGAILVTTIPRWLGGDSVPVWFLGTHAAIGLSGVVYAQWSCLIIMSQKDSEVANRFGEGTILIGIAFGLGSLTFSLVVRAASGLDNLSHLVGLPYGILWALALSLHAIRRRVLVTLLLLSHLLLWPIFQGLIHPWDNARYHWWLAEQTADPAEKQSHYQRALERNPDLAAIWLELAATKLQTQNPEDAWRTLVQGLKSRPHLEDPQQLSQQIWAAFATKEERQAAWRDVEKELAGYSFDWSARLLSPYQSARFHLEQDAPLLAWLALMQHLRGVSPPRNSSPANPLPLDEEFALGIWQKLKPGDERAKALLVMDEELEQSRRAWHQALIPNRDLIAHYQDQGELLWAWQAVMEELKGHPAFREEGKQIAREIWKSLPTEVRRERARNLVDEIFGMDRLQWQIELDILSEETRQRYRPDQSVKLSIEEDKENRRPSDRIDPINPDDPESAALGISL